MNTKERQKLESLLSWALYKLYDEFPDIDICFYDVQQCAKRVWTEVTGIEV